MKSKPQFSPEIIKRIHAEHILGIRAGTDADHRVIGIWAVVVVGRVFVAKRKRGIKVRAVLVKSEKLKEFVSAAYKEKYNTPGSVGYVADMSRSPSRDTTTELVPG